MTKMDDTIINLIDVCTSRYQYNKTENVGKGSFGAVYKGLSASQFENFEEFKLAVKVCSLADKQRKQAFDNEVKILEYLRDKGFNHMPEYRDSVQCDDPQGQPMGYIITELVPGDLIQLCGTFYKRPVEERKTLFDYVFKFLYYVIKQLMELGVTHNDLHAGNIVYAKENGNYAFKLIDFNSAEQIQNITRNVTKVVYNQCVFSFHNIFVEIQGRLDLYGYVPNSDPQVKYVFEPVSHIYVLQKQYDAEWKYFKKYLKDLKKYTEEQQQSCSDKHRLVLQERMYMVQTIPANLAKLFGRPVEVTGMILGFKFNARNSSFYYLLQFSQTSITRWLSLAELSYLGFRDLHKAKELHRVVIGMTSIQDEIVNVYQQAQGFETRK